jgi:hypothetical protein
MHSQRMLDDSAYVSGLPTSLDGSGVLCGRTVFAAASLKCACFNSKECLCSE